MEVISDIARRMAAGSITIGEETTRKAAIRVNGKMIHLGYHATAEEAARAYDSAARKYFGEFANPNFNDNCESGGDG